MNKQQVKILLTTLALTAVFYWIKEWGLICLTVIIGTSLLLPKTRKIISELLNRCSALTKQILYWFFVVVSALVIVLFVKTYWVDVLRLPSNSMEPNFQNGQIIVINKLVIGPRLNANDIDTYSRAKSFAHIDRNDIVVFNFPGAHADKDLETISQPIKTRLYNHFRHDSLIERHISFNPRYIKRVIALPGDTLEIKDGKTTVNGIPIENKFNQMAKYTAVSANIDSVFVKQSINVHNTFTYLNDTVFELETAQTNRLTDKDVKPFYLEKNKPDPNIFPHTYLWNSDNMGPLVVPAKGQQIKINHKNIALYRSIIAEYENNTLKMVKKDVFINGLKANSYTFKQNYYWVMGDNQPHSFDSRYWGFLPENHIIGVSRTDFNPAF